MAATKPKSTPTTILAPPILNPIQVYLVKKPVNFGPHFLVNESETR